MFWTAPCKNVSNLLLVLITVCRESCLPIGWLTFIWWKNPPKCMLLYFGLDWRDVGILYSQAITQRTNDVSPAFLEHVWRKRSRFKHMQTVIQTSRKFNSCMKRLRTLNSYHIFKIKNKKLKTYSGWRPFQGLSNGTTLIQIQSGWTVPLIVYLKCMWKCMLY